VIFPPAPTDIKILSTVGGARFLAAVCGSVLGLFATLSTAAEPTPPAEQKGKLTFQAAGGDLGSPPGGTCAGADSSAGCSCCEG